MLEMHGDSEVHTEFDDEHGLDDAIVCLDCGALVTRTRWRLAMDGEHERTFFNPAGHVFRVLCFREAPGTIITGEPSDEFSWFKGYLWRFALCQGCGIHLGWRYEGENDPPIFFGLIKGRLSQVPGDGVAAS